MLIAITKNAFTAIKKICMAHKRVIDLENKIVVIEDRIKEIGEKLDKHLSCYHIDVEAEFLKYEKNIIFNHKKSPPEALCPACHDERGKLIRLIAVPWDPPYTKYECHTCKFYILS